MNEASSISAKRRYGWSRVCRVWQLPRSTVHDWRRRRWHPDRTVSRRGRKPLVSDEVLLSSHSLDSGPGPGFDVLRGGIPQGVGTTAIAGYPGHKERIRRLMGEHNLLAPTRTGKPRGPRSQEGTIIPIAPNVMWGTDATAAWTQGQGQVTVFATVDHYTGECLGIHARSTAPGTKHWNRAGRPASELTAFMTDRRRQGSCCAMITGVSL